MEQTAVVIDITFTIPGEEPVTVNIKDGKDGRTPTIDLNALAEAAARLNNQRSGRVRRALADAPSTAPAEKPREGTLLQRTLITMVMVDTMKV